MITGEGVIEINLCLQLEIYLTSVAPYIDLEPALLLAADPRSLQAVISGAPSFPQDSDIQLC
jgi:hypothetical protein